MPHARAFSLRLIPLVILLAASLPAAAISYSATSSGDIATATTFTPNGVPTSADDVSVNSGVTLTVNANHSIQSLTMCNAGCTVQINNGATLTVGLNVNTGTGGTTENVLAVQAGVLDVGGDLTIDGSGGNNSRVTATTGTVNVTGNLAVNGNRAFLNPGNGTTITVGGNVSGTGTIDMSAGGDLQIGGLFSLTAANFTAGNGTVTYFNGGNLHGTLTSYNNLTISNGTRFALNPTTVNGDLFVDSTGYFYLGANPVSVVGNITIDGAVNDTAVLSTVGGTSVLDGTGIINTPLSLTAGTTIAATADLEVFNNVTVSGTGAVTNNGIMTVSVSVDGDSAGSQWVNATNSTLVVGGNLMTTGSLVASASGNTVKYASGNQTVFPTDYHHLELTSSIPGSKTMPATPMVVGGNFSMSGQATATAADDITFAGNVSVAGSASFNANTFTHSVAGHWLMSNPSTSFNAGTSTIDFNGAAAQTINASTFYDVTFSNSGTKTLGALVVQNDFTISGSGAVDGGTFSHTVGGNWVNTTNAFTAGTSQVTLNGAGAQSIDSTDFYGLDIAKATGTATLTGGVTVSEDLQITGGALQMGAQTLDVTGNVFLGSGTTLTNGGGTLSFQGDITTDGALLDSGSVVVNGNAAQDWSGSTVPSLSNLTIQKGGGDLTASVNLTVNGTLNLVQGNIVTTAAVSVLSGNISRTAGFVDGKLSLTWPSSPLTKTFHVGTTTHGYAPVDITANSTGAIEVTAIAGAHPLNTGGGAEILQMYWSMAGTLASATDLDFLWPVGAVDGTEANYVLARHNGASWFLPAATVTPATHTATASSVANYAGDWTVGADASVGGISTFEVSADGLAVAGTEETLTITAKDGLNNTVSFTGDISLTFSGAATSPNGDVPTAKDKTGVPIDFGTATVITFTNGVASTGATFYTAETAQVDVTDGTLTSNQQAVIVDPEAATALAFTTINGGNTLYANGLFSTTIESRDAYGNPSAVLSDTPLSVDLTNCGVCTGTLGGVVSGTIFTGSDNTTINGMVYDVAEGGVILTVNGLGSADSPALTFNAQASGFTVITTADSGAGSLRQIILDINSGACSSPCLVDFAIGSGAQTLALTSTLPSIDYPVTLDATTQPGYAGTPLIEIDGLGAGGLMDGLVLFGNSSTIRGFILHNFDTKAMFLDGSGNVVENCWIGIDENGLASPNTTGIMVWGATNTIGGTTPAERNVISGNITGVLIENSADANIVRGNYIGTDPTGLIAIGNGVGVQIIDNAQNNIIGGAAAADRNIISGNTNAGVSLEGSGLLVDARRPGSPVTTARSLRPRAEPIIPSGDVKNNSVIGNWIGLGADGLTTLGNPIGVYLVADALENFIGMPAAGNVITGGAIGIAVAADATVSANSFLDNSIYNVSSIGIDVNLDGPTPNDLFDGDSGPQGLQNFADVSLAELDGAGDVNVTYSIDSSAAGTASILVQVFEADSGGSGQTLIGWTCHAGNAFTQTVSYPVGTLVVGDEIVTTATSYSDAVCGTVLDGTSEFSPIASVVACTPPDTTITAASAFCANSTGNAASVTITPGASYSWTISGGTITAGGTSDTITFDVGPTGTVSLGVTVSTATCTASGSHSGPINALPPATISGATSVCANSSSNIVSVPATAGATYLWSITNGTITSGGTSDTMMYTAGATGSVSLSVTVTNNGCSASDSSSVTINPIPSSTITADASACPNESGLIASVTPTAGATYTWSITNGTIIGGAGTPSITFTAGASGTTGLSLFVVANGCGSSSTHNVTIEAGADATVTAPASVCESSTGNAASVPFQAGAVYAWSITNGTITSPTTGDAITFDAGATGPVSLGVTVTVGSCSANGSASVPVDALPDATVTAPVNVCASSVGNTASVPATAGATYAWSITNGTITSPTNSDTITFDAGASGTVTLDVIVTSGACSVNATEVINIDPIPSSTITAPGAACPGAAGLSASVPATAGATYAWSITNGTITSATNLDSITFTAGAAGTTTLNVTVTANGCPSSSSHNVTIGTLPDATITAPAAVCETSTGNVASAPFDAAATYLWSITNGTITGGQGSNSITFDAGASGTVGLSLDVTKASCTASGSTTVPITANPASTITAAANVCANSTGNGASVVPVAVATYLWTIANGTFTSPTNSDSVTFTAGASGSITLGVTVTANGCSSSSSHVVVIDPQPSAVITAAASTCPDATGLSAMVPFDAAASYSWTITNGTITGGAGTHAITFDAGSAGTTTLDVTVVVGSCTSSGTHNVTIGTAPSATITAPASVCESSTGNAASVPAQAGATYLWTITNGTIDSGAGTDSITFTAGATGSITLGVTVTVNGCASSSTQVITIDPPPSAAITAPASTCPNATGLSASVPFVAGATYAWSIANGTITSASTSNAITFDAGASGVTTLSVTVVAGNCTSSGSTNVTISAAPAAAITAPTSTCAGSTGNNASATPVVGATYAWTITNGTITSSATASAITFTAGASGNVTLGVTVTKSGCSTTASHVTIVNPLPDATITAPANADAGQSVNASVPSQPGATYAWSIANGTITAGAGTHIITFDAGASGSTTLNLTVTLGGCSASSSHTVNINGSSADLAVTKSAAASAAAGSQVTYTIVATNNGPDAATLIDVFDALPAGASLVSFGSGTFNCYQNGAGVTCSGGLLAGASATMTVTVQSPSVEGSLTNTVTIQSPLQDPNSANNSASATTTLTAPQQLCPASAPVLNGPAQNATVTSPVTFSWSSVANATAYELWIDDGSGESLAGTTAGTSLTLPLSSGDFTWRVVVFGQDGCDQLASSPGAFTVEAGANCDDHLSPQLTAPSAGSVAGPDVTFSWTPVPQAIGYKVWVEINGASPQEVGSTNGALTLTATLPPGAMVAFVEALFGGCPATSSERLPFSVPQPERCSERAATTLLAPANETMFDTSNILFNWTGVPESDGYRLWTIVDGGPPSVLGTTVDDTSLETPAGPGRIEWFVETLFDGCASVDSQHRFLSVVQRTECPALAPQLLSPAANAAFGEATVTFTWGAVPTALGYELWLSVNRGTPALFATTTDTTVTGVVAEGHVSWFVRAILDACPPTESLHSEFDVTLPDQCSTAHRPIGVSPLSRSRVTSPVDFSWTPTVNASSYDLFVRHGDGEPVLRATTANTHANGVELPNGNIRWFVRAHVDGCPSLDSGEEKLQVVAPAAACATIETPQIAAVGQVSSGVPFAIFWSESPGATGYELQLASSASFNDAETVPTESTQHVLTRVNQGTAEVGLFARVRAIDARCQPEPVITPFSLTAAVFVLPLDGVEGSTPAGSDIVTHNIELGPELAGQSFTAVPDEEWLTVEPASGVVGPEGTLLVLTAHTADLPLGTSLAAVRITLVSPTAAGGVRANATTLTVPTMSVNKVTPVTPNPKSTPPPDALIIPAVAHADGVNSKFQSDVRVTNSSAQLIQYQLTFTPSGDTGITTGRQTTLAIDPGRTIALDDVLKSWFGTGTGSVTGTLEVRPLTQTATSTPSNAFAGLPNLVTFAASRTFNTTPNGTFGQHIPAIPYANFLGSAAPGSFGRALSLQQIAQSDRYRTNLGIVEASGQAATALVKVFGSNGQQLTQFPVTLAGGQHTQLNSFLTTNGIPSLSDGRVEISVTSPGGKITAYASVLDNATGDPLLVTPVTLSELGASKWVVPGVADLDNSTANWQTDMRLFNAGTTDVETTLTFVSQNGGEPKVNTLTIPAGQVRQLDRTLATVFGISNDGGAVHISTPSAARLVATARTYNQTTNGSYGQFISAVTPNEAAGVGSRPLQILQIEESNRFRSNVGLAEVTGNPVTLEISVVPPDAKFTAVTQLTLQGNEFRQLNSMLRSVGLQDTYNARVTVRAVGGGGRVTAYASVIDMLTNDPTYVPAQ